MRGARGGFSLMEVLVVLAVAAALLAVAAVGLSGYVGRLRLEQDLSLAAGAFRAAVSEVRRSNTGATLSLSDKTLTLKRGATTLQTVTLSGAPELSCSPGCPAGQVFALSAPFGRNDVDLALKFRRGARERTLLVRGPLGLVTFQ